MADIAVTAAQVNLIDPEFAEVYSAIAAVALTAGQPVYFQTNGKANIADANGTSPAPQFKGIALQTVGAGQAVDVLKRGRVAGYTVSSLNAGAIVYLSDTAGSFADAAGTTSVKAGQVVTLTDSDATKVVYIDADWSAGY